VGGVLAMTSALVKLLVGVAFILIAIALGPILGIWALNTLFPVLHIPLTWETWLAFNILFGGSLATRLKK
jgi:hypothetical protein